MTRWSVNQDPHADREATKYNNPVPSREFIMEWLENYGRPLTHMQLCERMGLTSDDDIEALRRRLKAMERDGQLLSNRKGAYGLISKMQLVKGRIDAHADGFGFLVPDEGGEDLFLSNHQMKLVYHGDYALARIVGVDRRGRKEGAVVEVLQHNTKEIVGHYKIERNGIGYVQPDNPKLHHDVLIPAGKDAGALDGQIVSVAITQQPARRAHVQGAIKEVLGDEMAPGMEIDIAIRKHNIPHEFPEEVLEQIRNMSDQVQEADKLDRVDLRHLPFVTIDGEDAKDFDDAVYCEKKRLGSWKLFVAIADVSHYVGVDTPLDHEAHRRGNSVYFPGQVVPMLPELLSNGLCSLNPHVDRLVMVCEMSISAKGEISRYRFCEAVIQSQARLTYTQVGALLEDEHHPDAAIFQEKHSDLISTIHDLYGLYKQLRIARSQRGAIDFETVETRIVFDENRKIECIVPVVRNEAHKLIEECMLCANVASARLLEKYKVPGLFRVHKGPKEQRLEKLKSFLGELGFELGGGLKPTPEDYQDLMQAISERPDAGTIQTMLLQSLSQAVYSPENEGHFGLNYKAYTHFTSPIRRYPDLLLHRAIRALIRSDITSSHLQRCETTPAQPRSQWLPYSQEQMIELGEHCSMTERRADDATYDVLAWLKCEYTASRVGESFTGKVTGVTGFGLFVRLDEIYVEGLVHITGLPSDYYQFDPLKQRLRGDRSGRVYGINDELTVIVARVDLDDRKIDFELDQSKPDDSVGRKRQPRKRVNKTSEVGSAQANKAIGGSQADTGGAKNDKPKKNSRKRKLKPAEKGRSGMNDSVKKKAPKKKKVKKIKE